MKLAIFGAQGNAIGTCHALRKLYPDQGISCFLVSRPEENPTVLCGLPVNELKIWAESMTVQEKQNTEIWIAIPENVQEEVEKLLHMQGFECCRRITSEVYAGLMELYYARQGIFLPLSVLPAGKQRVAAEVYVAKHEKDKPLRHGEQLPDEFVPIQVGAEGAKRKIADIQDNEGRNISCKNGNYCELTALYWIWKNRLELTGGENREESKGQPTYVGLAHYRRFLMLSRVDWMRLAENNVDVILPYPMIYEPDIHDHHRRYLKEVDWQAMLLALREIHPEDAEKCGEILSKQFFYNYNLVLAKREVLRRYCEWLFPVLERVEELSVPEGLERNDRYLGYMGETLETLYFMVNADRFHIAHSGCRMLV